MLVKKKIIFFFSITAITVFSIMASPTITASPREPLPCLNKKFSIIAHIVRSQNGMFNIDSATILSRIESMNADFTPICVSFEVCEFRYIDNYLYDILSFDNEWEQLQVKYHEANRINMFFVGETSVEGEVPNFATYEGIAILDRGGIVMTKTAEVRDYSREMGQYLGLYRTFDNVGGVELVNGSNCATTGDQICDTPADPYIILAPIQPFIYLDRANCRFIYLGQDVNGDYYSPSIGNIMSYYPDECACEFTYEQYQKMASTYLLSNPKMW